MKFRNLMGRRANSSDDEIDDDVPIIHDKMPESVRRSLEPKKSDVDMSFLDDVGGGSDTGGSDTRAKASPAPSGDKPAARQEQVAQTPAPAAPAPVSPAPKAANQASTTERPSHPYGWLVVVEGKGVGEWFVLERGVSHIGSAVGQTVHLSFGDLTVDPDRHAELEFDEAHKHFVLNDPQGKPLRVNGISVQSATKLRDGDVISVGETALRLVALCSQNFSWGELR